MAVVADLYDFIPRPPAWLLRRQRGVPRLALHRAVAELKPKSLYDFDRRIDAIGTFAQLPRSRRAGRANKRIGNILKKATDEIPHIEDEACCANRRNSRWPKRWKRSTPKPATRWRTATTSMRSPTSRGCGRRSMPSSTR